jgi:CheY-like chemotaxis protein
MKDKPVILIVDDEVRNIELQKAYLEPCNYKILTASNGEEAIKAATRNSIDLILLDVMMPGKNGFAVTKHLKSHEKTRVIPIVHGKGGEGQGHRGRMR